METVNERLQFRQEYQTQAENLRSAHLLKYISAWKTLTNFLSLGLYYCCFEIEYYYFEFTTHYITIGRFYRFFVKCF
ncbi:unnamed protein product, partial [Mesorhabditis belari]|uniref:Uncharacterized protein n=1 Tax=Mesorhabditis belari TaxID=2138241 RepID=A0AAF3F2G5_9BILA